jgi:ribosome-associated protein
LVNLILEGIESKKAEDIKVLDLRKIPSAVCDVFILCTGNSNVQVEAIASGVIDEVRDNKGGKPWHVEGLSNKEWVLIDYVQVVVHIFQPEIRTFYALEQLWADAPEFPLYKD